MERTLATAIDNEDIDKIADICSNCDSLQIAVEKNSILAVELILSLGVKGSNSLLQYAMYNSSTNIVLALIENEVPGFENSILTAIELGDEYLAIKILNVLPSCASKELLLRVIDKKYTKLALELVIILTQ